MANDVKSFGAFKQCHSAGDLTTNLPAESLLNMDVTARASWVDKVKEGS